MNNNTQYRPVPKCITTFGNRLTSAINISLTSFDAMVIPFIIAANLLSMIGIIKTKRVKFLPSQILFILLFLSDLTFGLLQIPLQIYLLWKKGKPTCIEIQIRAFSIIFPLCVSGTNLFMISVDRYMYVAHDIFYKKIVSNKILSLVIFLILAVSFIWAIMDIVLANTLDIKRLAQYLVALSAYEGTILVLIVFFNIFKLNAALNSVVYITRNVRIKRYYKRLFMCQTKENQLTNSTYSKGSLYKVGHSVSTCSLANSINVGSRSSLQSNLHCKINKVHQKN